MVAIVVVVAVLAVVESDASRQKKARTLTCVFSRFGASRWWRTFHESFRHDVELDRSCRFNVEGCHPISDLNARCCSWYGLRAERVGEAKNPGPPRLLWRTDRERLTRFNTLVDTDSDDVVRDTMADESNPEPSVPVISLTEMDTDVSDTTSVDTVYDEVPGLQGRRRLVIMGVENRSDPIGRTQLDEVSGEAVLDGDMVDDREGQSDLEVESALAVAPDPAVTVQAEREWLAWTWRFCSHSDHAS